MDIEIAKEILWLQQVVIPVKPKTVAPGDHPNKFLDDLGIPIFSCKVCNLHCGSCSYRCNLFAIHYRRDLGTYDTENGFVFHEVSEELKQKIYEQETEAGED